jgi:proteasome beta subunit
LTRRDGVVLAAKTRASVELLVANKHLIRVQQLDRHVIKRMAGGIADVRNQTNNMRYNADIGRVKEVACACKKLPVDYSPAIFSLLHQIIHSADYEGLERQIYNIDFFSSRSVRLIVNGR